MCRDREVSGVKKNWWRDFMDTNDNTKKDGKMVWPGREAAIRRLLLIAAVLFPCTWFVTALLVKSWNLELLSNPNAECFRHLMEAAVIFVGAVCIVFLISLLPTFRRFFDWMVSWRIVRRMLIGLAWIVTIIALFYGEEDWRGRHAWNTYSEALKAQGAELDLKTFVPKPIPDEENFAATPEIKSWFTERGEFPARWGNNFSLAGAMISEDSSKGPRHFVDLVAWQMAFDAVKAGNTNSTQTFKSGKLDAESRAKAAPTIMEALKSVEGQLAELRAVSGRPHGQYPVVYDLENPWGILLPHLGNIKTACQRLQLKACAELALGQSDRALEDVKLMLRLGDSLKEESFLISYLVRIAILHIAIQPVWEGLAEHRWSDAQLQELQKSLERYDFVADMNPPFDSERAAGILTADLLAAGKFTLNNLASDPSPLGSTSANEFGRIMPRGWYDMEKFNYTRLYNVQIDGAFDVQKRGSTPTKSNRIRTLWIKHLRVATRSQLF